MSDATAGDRESGEFERYGLLAALTLVVLCLLLADRLRSAPRPVAPPPADRLLRLRIGGDAPAATPRTAPHAAAVRADAPPGVPRANDVSAAPQRVPDAPPQAVPRTCVVAEGETLGDIARRELGTSRRASEIAELNGIEDVHLVRAGQSLRLPPR